MQPATTSATTTAAGQAFSDFQPLDARATYTTVAFKPAIRIELPKGKWISEVGDTAKTVQIAAADPPGKIEQAILAVHRVDEVFDPKKGGTQPGDVVPLRGDFVDWLEHIRGCAPRDGGPRS